MEWKSPRQLCACSSESDRCVRRRKRRDRASDLRSTGPVSADHSIALAREDPSIAHAISRVEKSGISAAAGTANVAIRAKVRLADEKAVGMEAVTEGVMAGVTIGRRGATGHDPVVFPGWWLD